jgi:hypothetical protein
MPGILRRWPLQLVVLYRQIIIYHQHLKWIYLKICVCHFEKQEKNLCLIHFNLVHSIDLWTKHDVQKWIEYCIDEYSLGEVSLNDFEMNGKIFFFSSLIYK